MAVSTHEYAVITKGMAEEYSVGPRWNLTILKALCNANLSHVLFPGPRSPSTPPPGKH